MMSGLSHGNGGGMHGNGGVGGGYLVDPSDIGITHITSGLSGSSLVNLDSVVGLDPAGRGPGAGHMTSMHVNNNNMASLSGPPSSSSISPINGNDMMPHTSAALAAVAAASSMASIEAMGFTEHKLEKGPSSAAAGGGGHSPKYISL
jgi:hypothetical protein